MHYQTLIDQYLAGSDILGRSIKSMSDEQLDAKPIPGKWSTRQVVCHIVDFEPIYADRMKRVIAENCPTFFGGDPDIFAAGLAYDHRPVGTELELLTAVRAQMATILRELKAEDFQRTGNHSEAGTLSLETLLQRITGHVPHHVTFIDEKRKALGL
jgi:DinB superfamily